MENKSKKLVIITGYFQDESYGLLGPQMAATIINDHSEYQARVVAITNEYDKNDLKKALNTFFGDSPVVVGFSTLGGRTDLFDFAKALKNDGVITFLAGPQAGVDFKGEVGCEKYGHRFKGLSDCFSFAIQGPGQQMLPLLKAGFHSDISRFDGVLVKNEKGHIIEKPSIAWDDEYLAKVDWQNIYRLQKNGFEPFNVDCAQVIAQIGCPHASKDREVIIEYPQILKPKEDLEQKKPSARIHQKGCSFCDVAADKGFKGAVSEDAIKQQLACLPEHPDGTKIAFELINESPLPKLAGIFKLADDISIQLSQVNLTMRADYFLKGLDKLEAALKIAQEKNVRILLASIGFESFEDTILHNLNKGVTRQMNLDTIRAIRDLKPKFPYHFGYLKEEGANHGFIHPTPWDSPKISQQINRTIAMYQLAMDILPNHSTPLIIHHASGLGDWIRQIEIKEDIVFERIGTTIAWWQTEDKTLV
ncbi:MAG: hypothetical protein L3J69_04025 [Desulfobacula sp.]|nr:hypothetical protein [Desulfobacula sp.]